MPGGWRKGKPLTELSAEPAEGHGEHKPIGRIPQAHLPQEIKAKLGIIPHVPMQQAIDHTAYQEFRSGDDSGAHQSPLDQRAVPAAAVHIIDRCKAYAAGERHTPMGEAPPEKLYQAVAQRADEKQPGNDFQLSLHVSAFPDGSAVLRLLPRKESNSILFGCVTIVCVRCGKSCRKSTGNTLLDRLFVKIWKLCS